MPNAARRFDYASAGAVRRREPDSSTEEADLHAEMIALSQKFFAEADILDAAFVRNTDKRARERGAFCAEAVTCRYVGSQLRELARNID